MPTTPLSDRFPLVVGLMVLVFSGLLLLLLVQVYLCDRRAAARLRRQWSRPGVGQRRAWTVSALRQREHGDATPRYPASLRTRATTGTGHGNDERVDDDVPGGR
jgi:Tfp pilus assembly protein PilX